MALDHLFGANGRAYVSTAWRPHLIESRAEGGVLGAGTGEFDVVMFAAPLLAWSRFTIPSGTLPGGTLAAARIQPQADVLAAGTRLALADFLYSPDQLPRGFVDLAADQPARQGGGRRQGGAHRPAPAAGDDALHFRHALPDRRRRGAARPCSAGRRRTARASRRRRNGSPRAAAPCSRASLGCARKPPPPHAYHAACRNADQGLRVYSLRAAAAFLQTVLNVKPQQLRAVMAPFHEERLEEYRVGFMLADSSEVVHSNT